jgi:hypothetical protein
VAVNAAHFLAKQGIWKPYELSYDEYGEIIPRDDHFEKLLRFLSKDSQTNQNTTNGPADASIYSEEVQLELINLCAEQVIQTILNEVKESKHFSLIATETCGEFGEKHLSLVLRYMNRSGEISERFVGLSGESNRVEILVDNLSQAGLNFNDMVSSSIVSSKRK